MRVQRMLLAMRIPLSDRVGTSYLDDGLRRVIPDGGRKAKAELKRLEGGSSAIVHGWAIGVATDASRYVLKGDGSVQTYQEQ